MNYQPQTTNPKPRTTNHLTNIEDPPLAEPISKSQIRPWRDPPLAELPTMNQCPMNYLTIYKHRVSRIRHWASCGENPTLAHFRHFSSLYTNEYRVSRYESFMQNKPNLLDAQMNLKSFHTVDYENIANCKLGENKPKQTQFPSAIRNTRYEIQTQSNPISKAVS